MITTQPTQRIMLCMLLAGITGFCSPLAFAQNATLSGTVMDEKAGQPIAGAKVELSNSNAGTGYFITHTGPDGRFSFTQVRTGLSYDLGVLANGYCPYEMQGWSVPDNQTTVDMTLPLVQGAMIRGKTTASDGETPVQNAQITLTYESGDFQMLHYEQSLYTDKEGLFQFPQIPPNQYRLTVSRGGYIGEQIVGIRPKQGEEKNFAIKLFKPGSISGTVMLDENSSPLPDIEIAARGASQRAGTTDENGFFTIGSLKPGNYQLQSHPSGFRPYESLTIFQLQEGENKSDAEIRMNPLPPALSVSLNREVFLPEQDLVFQIRTFRIGQYECDIHGIPASVFLSENTDIRGLIEESDLAPFPIALHWQEDVDFTNPFVWVDKNVQAPEKLPPGAYVLRIYSPNDQTEDRVLFFVTQLGIIVKRGEKNTFVYATDLKTSMPIENANIRVVSHSTSRRDFPGWTKTFLNLPNEDFAWHGKTDPQGIALIQHNFPAQSADVIAISPEGQLAVSQVNQSGLIHSQSNTIYAYTDRPVYRPGHTVFYKAIFRDKDEQDYRIPVNETTSITIRNPEEVDIFSSEHTTNEWGSIHGSFELPSSTPLGRYQIFAKSSTGVVNSIHFFVEEYRKPEFKVDVNPEKPFYINGQTLSFTIQSEYYFGAPVPNAEVRYRLYESFATGGESHDYPSSYSSFLTSGETRTDAEGMARIEYAPNRSSRDRRISIEVDILEASGRKVSGSSAVPIGVGAYYITAKPAKNVFDKETPLSVKIATRTHDNKAIAVPVDVEFIQEVWNPVRRRYERPSRPQASKSGTTDEQGQLVIDWLPDDDLSGRIEVMVTSVDPDGNRITTSTQLWRMAFRAGSFDLQYPTLEGILDKDSYQPGEEATLLINTTFPENPVILTIEGRDVMMHRVIWPAGKTTAITLPVLPEYAPNVYVSLFMPRETNLSTRTYNLNVPVQRGELTIEVRPDRETYKPGDTGTIQIKTSLPDGSPVASEVSLAVVDESLFAIRSDHTPNIHSIFYDRQSNWVLTTHSYPLKYFGGANKGVNPDIRRNFRDTALWVANVHTDETGLATAEVTYPDNLTTWRMTARGHTKKTEVGWTKSKSMVTKDIVARLSLPRFFIEGDRVKIPTLVNNLSSQNLAEIQTQMTVEGGVELKETNQKTTQAAAGAVARQMWDIEVTAASPEASFTFEARSPIDADALQLTTPVLPLGYRLTKSQSGKMLENSQKLSFPIEESIRIQQSSIQLHLTPSLAAVALGAMPYLTEFPYGCVEQTLNGYLPNLLLLHTLDELGILPPENKASMSKFASIINRRLTTIYSYQNWDGGWGWFDNSNTDLNLSAVVVLGLHETRRMGYNVDQNRLNNGIEYLKNNLSQTRVWDNQAYVTYVLSQVMDEEPPLLDELYTNMTELHDIGLAAAALAFHKFQKDKEANEILDSLLSRITTISDRQAAWQSSPELMLDWNGTDSETTAWGLKALVTLRGLTPEADKIVQWLIDQRWGDHWRSTRETAAVVDALRCVIQAEEKQDNLEDLDYQISIQDNLLTSGTISKEAFTKPFSIDLPLQNGANNIQITLSRPQGFWSLDASLFRQGETPKGIPHQEFSLTRTYERAIHTRDYRGRPKILTESFSADDVLAIGQEILVTLVIQTKTALPYLILEDPLPSGCEIVESFLRQIDDYWKPFNHYERRDQKMVFFLDQVPEGEVRIEYLMRAELQGSFHTNPARIGCMYYPDYFALSAGNRIQVNESNPR